MTQLPKEAAQAAGLKLSAYLRAGMLAGIGAALLNVVIYTIMVFASEYDMEPVVAGSIVAASLLPNLLAAVVYFFLRRFISPARLVLTAGILIFVLVSILPHLGIGPAPSPALSVLPEGFDLFTVPLHLVFGLSGIFLMPWLIERESLRSK